MQIVCLVLVFTLSFAGIKYLSLRKSIIMMVLMCIIDVVCSNTMMCLFISIINIIMCFYCYCYQSVGQCTFMLILIHLPFVMTMIYQYYCFYYYFIIFVVQIISSNSPPIQTLYNKDVYYQQTALVQDNYYANCKGSPKLNYICTYVFSDLL